MTLKGCPAIGASGLARRAVLVRLSISCWPGQIKSREAAILAEEAAKAVSGAVVAKKKLLPGCASLAEAQRLERLIRRTWEMHTAPWTRGVRIIGVRGVVPLRETLDHLKDQFLEAAEQFHSRDYPALHERFDALGLGSLLNEADYPPPSSMKNQFSVETTVMPVPVAGHIAVQIDNDLLGELNKELEQFVEKTLQDAVREPVYRVMDAVSKLVSAIERYDPNDARGTRYNGTVVTNIRELAELLPGLNITGDQRLDNLSKELVTKLCRIDAEGLKTSPIEAARVRQEAKQILAKVSAWI